MTGPRRHRLLARLLTAALVSVTGVVFGATAAVADSVTVPGYSGGQQVLSLKVVRSDGRTTATARFERLAATGRARVTFDVGYDDRAATAAEAHRYVATLTRRQGAARPSVTWRRISGVDGNAKVRCRGIRAEWSRAKDRIRIRFSDRHCLGSDGGVARVGFGGSDDVAQGARVWTRPVQANKRGARYGDVSGDGLVDAASVSAGEDTYRVSVDVGDETLIADGPLSDDVAEPQPRVVSGLDINRDGRAELIVDPGDNVGSVSVMHVFTVFDGSLRLVRDTDGDPFRLVHEVTARGVRRDTTCAGSSPYTWRVEKRRPRTYLVEFRGWTLAGATATPRDLIVVSVPRGAAERGNWSFGSCLTE